MKPGTTSAHALCTACKKQFEVDGSGISQVNSHAKSVSHKKAVPSKSQVLLKVSPFGEVSHLSSLPEDLSDKMQALKAEIIDALYKIQYKYSFFMRRWRVFSIDVSRLSCSGKLLMLLY